MPNPTIDALNIMRMRLTLKMNVWMQHLGIGLVMICGHDDGIGLF
jgi:hypothetical protein